MNGTSTSTATLLDKIFWHALTGTQARFATGSGGARRYAPGFSPLLGFEDDEHPDFEALTPHCALDEHFYCAGWSGPAPAGWRIKAETRIIRMVWDQTSAPPTDVAVDARPINAEHIEQVLALAALTRPGPFGPRTIELGDYVGCFDGERLIAMAGERMQAGPFREISGVCTHPESRGRGHARRLMSTLICRQLQRGETPFLHVMRDNATAHQLYLRMGFSDYCATVIRVVSRC